MNHADLLADVGGLADELGVRWLSVPAPFYGSPGQRGHLTGFPDLFLAGPGGIAFAEVKTGGQLDPDQEDWRDVLVAAGATWHLWQPIDWLDGRIRRELQRLASPV
jgi:hypothetical protein